MCSQKADILENETLEDLQAGGLKLIQKKNGFRFGIDAVLLADFAKETKAREALDLCSGSGIIPVLLSHKSKIEHIFGLEIQEDVWEMSNRSVKMNKLEKRIFLENGDLKKAAEIYGKRRFDLVTVNPPYMPVNTAVKNELDTKIIARHEVMCTLEDVISASAQVLKQHARLLMVHKPTRLADIIYLMRKYDIEPKRIRFVHKKAGAEPSLLLIDGAYKGGCELRIMPPLYLYDEDGNETEELKRIYGK